MDNLIVTEISTVRNVTGHVLSILATGMVAFGGINMIIGALISIGLTLIIT